jgi:hypothetical protein
MKVCLEHLNRGQDGWLNIIAKRCQNSVHAKFAEGWLGELRRITLPRTWVNSPLILLRAAPLHAVHHLLGFGRELIELVCCTSKPNRHRLAFDVLQDEDPTLSITDSNTDI